MDGYIQSWYNRHKTQIPALYNGWWDYEYSYISTTPLDNILNLHIEPANYAPRPSFLKSIQYHTTEDIVSNACLNVLEQQVLRLIYQGYTQKQIAVKLEISRPYVAKIKIQAIIKLREHYDDTH